jgi:hypothetical protein
MDPFLESQEWEDFHTTLNTVVRESLSSRLEPRYVVRVERRVYVESYPDDIRPSANPSFFRSDAVVLGTAETGGGTAVSAGPATMVEPFECELPMPEERREAYLVIRFRETMEVVTVLETLSPANKRPGGDGRREYLQKREVILQSPSHLVELDLLRGGLRLPTTTPLRPGDYYAIVSRCQRRPRAAVYAWTIRDPLPSIPVPLKKGDPDVPLDLQAVFTTVYDRARYDLSLNYGAPLEPPLGQDAAEWVRRLVPPAKS